MLILLSEFEKAKKRTLFFIKLFILGFVSCVIVIIILTAYYQGLFKAYYPNSLALIYQELTLIEFFWMIILLLSFFFMNNIVWYYISYNLNKKSIKTLNFAEKNDVNDIICFTCGIERHIDNFKKENSKEIKPIKIFSVKGYFCKDCYLKYSWISLGTIILIPITYFLCILFIDLILFGINLSIIPESIDYLTSIISPVFILMIFIFVIYAIHVNIKISKIYGSKEQKFMN